MKSLMILLVLASPSFAASVRVASATAALSADPQLSYWEKEGFPMQGRFFGNIELSGKSIDELGSKVQKTMTSEGGKLTNVNTFNPEQMPQNVHQRPRRSFTYRVSSAKIEEIAAKVSALGAVEQYNVNPRQYAGVQMDGPSEIKARIDAIGAEMEQNRKALESMPIARALYAIKLERLKRSLPPEGEGNDAQLQISVVQASEGGKL